jgi:hypothetical protein
MAKLNYLHWRLASTTNPIIIIIAGFETFFYVVRHLDSTAPYLPTGLLLGLFRSWPSLFLPSSSSSVFPILRQLYRRGQELKEINAVTLSSALNLPS